MIDANLGSLKQTKPNEYVVRFLFGGACTVIAGLIAERYGPGMGGLFLAFPAIFPAGASLIEDHEKRRKRAIGRDGTNRGRLAASLDSAGAALGCISLVAFACTVFLLLPKTNGWVAIGTAFLLWIALSMFLWAVRRRRHHPISKPT